MTNNQLPEKLPESKEELRNLELVIREDGDWDLEDIIGEVAGMQLKADQLLYGQALDRIKEQQECINSLTENICYQSAPSQLSRQKERDNDTRRIQANG